MFRIRVGQAEEAYRELEQQVRELGASLEEVERVLRGLKTMSGLEGVTGQCERERERLAEEGRAMRRLLMGLGKVLLSYKMCENRIVDNGECGVRHYEPVPVGLVRIDRRILQGMGVRLGKR